MATATSAKGLVPFICQTCRKSMIPSPRRAFSSIPARRAEGALGDLSTQLSRAGSMQSNRGSPTTAFTSILDTPQEDLLNQQFGLDVEQPHRLHVYAHKHNTHLTFVQPSRFATQTPSSRISPTTTSAVEQKKMIDVMLSVSTGNIGFKKAGRGSYDAAYQLAAYTLKQIQERGMLYNVNKLEVVLRGFGAGREAVTKALLGAEGKHFRGKITSVKDATRLKQGGARAKKPRRLG